MGEMAAAAATTKTKVAERRAQFCVKFSCECNKIIVALNNEMKLP